MSTPTQDERIKAARYFGIHEWAGLRCAALKFALCECAKLPGHRDTALLDRLAKRFRIGAALAFYQDRPELYWTS